MLDHLGRASFVVELRDLGEDKHHDYGFTVEPFFEFVTVDVPKRVMVLIAGGCD